MKKFNASIQIEVAVDTIAAMLLAQFALDFKHRELVAETIIGRMLAEDKAALSKLYNSLNGHVAEIDFKVGDVIVPESVYAYGYWTEPKEGETKTSTRKVIDSAIIIDINVYASNDLTIEYSVPQSDGRFKMERDTITHTRCKKTAK